MVKPSPQNRAAQWGIGNMHELMSVFRAVGHCSRLPIFVFALYAVSLGPETVLGGLVSLSPVFAVEILQVQVVDGQARRRELVEVFHGGRGRRREGEGWDLQALQAR